MIHSTLKLSLFFIFIGNAVLGLDADGDGTDDCTSVGEPMDVSSISLDSNKDWLCDKTPSAMKMKLYGLYLCENLPDPSNYINNCAALVQNSSAVDVEVSNGTTTTLTNGDISVKEGTYNFAVVVVDPTISGKHTQEFVQDLRGATGIGKFCWTTTVETKSYYAGGAADFSHECGNAASVSEQYSGYDFKYIWGGSGPVQKVEPIYAAGLGNPDYTARNVYLMKSEETPLIPSDWTTDADGFPTNDPANFMLGVQLLENPVVISPKTKNIDLGFNVVLTYYMKLTQNTNYGTACDGTGEAYCIATLAPDSFNFKITAE